MNISILGTNGFLSNAIADYFWNKGAELHMYGLTEPVHPYTTFSAINLITESPDYNQLCLSDLIIYAVGAGIQSNLNESCSLIYALNVTVPINICNKLKEYNFNSVFVSFGSVFEVGNTKDERYFDEDDILTSTALATSDYAISKRMLSQFIHSYKHEFKHWHFYIPTIYGEGENPLRLIPYTINAIKTGEKLSFTSGEQTRQYVYVREIPVILDKSLERSLPDGIYNIEGNETLTVKEIVTIIHQALGANVLADCFGKAQRTDTGMKFLALNGDKLKKYIQYKPLSTITDIIQKY